MKTHNQSTITFQVQHDDAFVDDVPPHPYHKRFFDVIIVSQSSPPDNDRGQSTSEKEAIMYSFKNRVSIMSYEDAIIIALLELHDHRHIGSPVHAIKKHLIENITKENMFFLSKSNTKESAVQYFDHDCFKSSLFTIAMKSLIDKGVIVSSSHLQFKRHNLLTCQFLLSNEFLHRKFEVFKKRMSLLERMRESKQRNNSDLMKMTTKEAQKHIPASRIKPHLSKMRLIDQMAIFEKGEKKTKINVKDEMELDSVRLRKKCTVLVKIAQTTKKGFVIKRSSICTRKKLKHPNTIVLQSK